VKEFEGRTAFITGGASGIGLGMARAFLGRGMNVVIADLLQTHIDEVAAEFHGENRLHFIRLDVAQRAEMAAAATETERVFGKVHVLCNNAGVSQRNAIDVATYEDWDYVLGVNVGGTIAGLVEFLPLIKKHGEGGHVVTTSSMAGMIPVPGFAGIYATSKFAVRGMTDSLRLALAPHRIGASVLCPGMTKTRAMTAGDLYRSKQETGAEQVERRDPAGFGMDPNDVGLRVVEAIERNEPYIFPHGEFRDEVRGYFDEMVAAFPEEQDIDPDRKAMEERRARITAEQKAAAAAIDG